METAHNTLTIETCTVSIMLSADIGPDHTGPFAFLEARMANAALAFVPAAGSQWLIISGQTREFGYLQPGWRMAVIDA